MTDPTSNQKLYAERDHYQLSPQYERHLLAMTAEGLYSKSAIAAELAYRDIEIERLRPMAESWESYEAAQERKAEMQPVETTALVSVKDEREIEELRAALKVAKQALAEFSHAQECGPEWYTRGESGMYAQVRLWMRRGHEAISKALGPYDDNGQYLKEMPAVEPTPPQMWYCSNCKSGNRVDFHHTSCPACGKLRLAVNGKGDDNA